MRPQKRQKQISSNNPVTPTGRQPQVSSKQADIQRAEVDRFKAFPSRVTVFNWSGALGLSVLDTISLPEEITSNNRDWIVTGVSLDLYPEGFKADLKLNRPSASEPASEPQASNNPQNPEQPKEIDAPTTNERWANPQPGFSVISAYGWRPSTSSWHNGLDFAAPAGTKSLATLSGTVTHAGWYGGYGNTVDIVHNLDGVQFMSRYAHASKILVTKGQRVRQGQPVIEVGSTGVSQGNHLHFEIRSATNLFKQAGSLNPFLLIRGLNGVPGSVKGFTIQHSAGANIIRVAEKYR